MDQEPRNDLHENASAPQPQTPPAGNVPPFTPPPPQQDGYQAPQNEPPQYNQYGQNDQYNTPTPTPQTSSRPKSTAPKRSTQSSASTKKSTAGAKKDTKTTRSHSNKEDADKGKNPSFTTASSNSAPRRPQKQPVNTDIPRSARPAHRVLPYIFYVLAVFIGICLISNLFCNANNKLAETPNAHWIGSAGYAICYWLFGLFGPAVFVLPVLLVALGIYWKRYIDNRLATFKILTSLVFMILLAAVIHVCCLSIWDPETRRLSATQLIDIGSRMTMGGLIGGGFGYFLTTYFNIVGSIIVGVCLLLIALFCILGMTPHHLWNHIRMRRQAKRAGRGTVSEADAQAAGFEAKMHEKMKRTAAKRDDDIFDTPDENGIPQGAVVLKNPQPTKRQLTPEEIAREKERKKEERMAPMPIPVLDPNEGKLFVPADVNRHLKEQSSETVNAAPAPTTSAPTKQAASPTPTSPTPLPAPDAQKPLNPAANKDTAIDPIFPQSERATRPVPRAERNFDLKNVFIEDLDIGKDTPKKHSPVPPEVPMPGTGAKPTPRPAAAKATTTATLQSTKPATPSARPSVGAKPTAAAQDNATPFPSGTITVKKPTAASKAQRPVVHKVSELAQKEFGLSSEEFERLEAQRPNLPKAGAKPTTKTTADAKPAAKPTPKPAPPPKPKRYAFPPITYLHAPEPMTAENREEIEASVTNLSTTLQNFRININSIAYSCGPTVTRYELTPAAGVRVRSIVNLADDISLAFASKVRIEAPIPGKSAVGIEVPNKNRSNVFLRELIESKAFTEAPSKLTACLGADVTGKPLLFDIAKMPHLLVAGATGMGKSVCINSIIMSLLYKARPDEVKLILIDPKKVEFGIYKGIPHLLAPIVTAPKDAAGALQAAVEEMENRFELIQQVGVHDIKGYNKATENDPDMPFMPQIVIIIDELADLMMTAPDEVETAICRLAQKARAAGMHIIIGTQRPSVDVVTGLIKSNIPSRIAFTVASQVDSRTILDVAGAEKLIGRGDMLFAPVGAMGFTRVQGAFVDEKEVENICEFIRVTNGTATYDERFTSKMKELSAQCGKKGKGDADLGALPEGGGKGDDAKYSDAVRIAVEEKKISTSLLQRKLEIGYSRAAKLIDRMQAEGIVSPPDGSKPRTILITPEEYIAKFIDCQTDEG